MWTPKSQNTNTFGVRDLAILNREYDHNETIKKLKELRTDINFEDRSVTREIETLQLFSNSVSGVVTTEMVPLEDEELDSIYDASDIEAD